MSPLLPSPVTSHTLKLPELDPLSQGSLSECEKRARTLSCRTGSAVILARSAIFVHGGFTIPLDLAEVDSISIQKELILYFSRESKAPGSFQNLSEWISTDTFFLDLISRTWERVVTEEGTSPVVEGSEFNKSAVMRKRVFHSMCHHDGHLYIFGGLVVSSQSDYELIASNELWSLDLETKTWLQLSSDPSITRRFNHNMHLVPGNDESEDTRIYIVGGLNNFDRPVHVVDCFNLTQQRWEFADDGSNHDDGQEIITNINGQNTHLIKSSSFSLLLRNQISDEPSLAMYNPSDEGCDDIVNPFVAQPLVPGSRGQRMMSFQGHSSSERKTFRVPFNLQHASGDYFGYNIILSGFHPDVQPENFRCFTYNIPTGKWTEINTMSDDPSGATYRLWQLFVWHSHHKVVFLGTKEKGNHLPSVQKFDTLLCIALPMINVFHKAMHYTQGARGKSATSSEHLTLGHEGFEGYSRYSAPPLEITTIGSVFPSHAMALGKDSLEFYGQHLSDFEIVTEDGDSVRVPMYLLRKRWGRYFDEVLSQGYVKAIKDFENQNRHNEFAKLSYDSAHRYVSTPTTQHFGSTGSKDAPGTSSNGSFDAGNGKTEQGQVSQPLYPLVSRKSSPLFFANKSSQNDKADKNDSGNTDSRNAPVMHHSKSDSSAVCSTNTLSRYSKDAPDTIKADSQTSQNSNKTTSSSGGMVFRLPFQEASNTTFSTLVPHANMSETGRSDGIDRHLGQYNRRKSSASTSLLFDMGGQNSRRASHPAVFNGDERLAIPGIIQQSQSPFCSRKASVTSQNSSISYVSSTSDRMGNPAYRQMSQDSGTTNSTLNSVGSQIPPLLPMPTEPVPVAPQPHLDTTNCPPSAKNSPFSSRRSSLYHDLLRPGLASSVSQSIIGVQGNHGPESAPLYEPDPHSIHKRSMDRQLLEDNLIDVELEGNLGNVSQRYSTSKCPKVSRENSYGNASAHGEGGRPSYFSTADSNCSVTGTIANELEPLLLPRSLYMPWPTSTIKSFTEFFYTGQVNGKWLLSPVALNLLVMAKLYEIPLLYDLMSEVFYSILGRKEESLLTTAEAMRHVFVSSFLAKHEGNDETVKQLKENYVYQEILDIEDSLRSIDNGHFNMHLLRDLTRLGSTSSSESGERITSREGKDGTSLNVPILFAGGPRGSHNSVGSIGIPPNLALSPFKNAQPQKKSSLSKDVTTSQPQIANLEGANGANTLTLERTEKTNQENKAEKIEQQKLSNMSQNESSTFSTQIAGIKSPEGSCEGEVEKEPDLNMKQGENNKSLIEDSTSSSESGDISAGFGLASTSKIEKKLRRRDSEKSIDPLSKLSDSRNSSLKNVISYFKQGEKYFKTENSPRNVDTLTLDNMASPNALPPVDYVIELIHETASLVHDVRLIVRCISVIKLSKALKSLKQQLDHEFTNLSEEFRRAETPTDVTPRSPGAGLVKSDGTPTLTPITSVDKITKTNSNISLAKKISKPGTPESTTRNPTTEVASKLNASDPNLTDKSDTASINTKNSKTSSKQGRIKKVNSHLAGSGLTGAAMFMSGSFGPIPNKPKKEASSNNLSAMGGIPFFGKRK
ncbi:LAQU0S07e04676g1_1 [Lachancea quebecensis]|uniref:LAQU0S07e04676g1_1 n=1 Tax=Lachancea quebecensis TaxID=1654605 RepID=A0A0P1KZP5_9SACH|nr:LAQU0S07e04676g1_1 [Lachancea quebecensis]